MTPQELRAKFEAAKSAALWWSPPPEWAEQLAYEREREERQKVDVAREEHRRRCLPLIPKEPTP